MSYSMEMLSDVVEGRHTHLLRALSNSIEQGKHAQAQRMLCADAQKRALLEHEKRVTQNNISYHSKC